MVMVILVSSVVIIAIIVIMHSALWAATSRITGPSVIALPIVPVTVTHTRIIATTIEVIAVDVDAVALV